ncbi:hypothetical protein BB561_006976 [Smittium simulii]|uniref:Uncharacterized protein n=1 Tax=Smittium simulii TaxID=133385 RepID=A0A2T9XYR9_9FUNG|nr:hypothetical protein BB561_006976 [Smittium simulii]
MSIKFKVIVIKAIIQALATYGGKFFGMSETRCKPLQQVVDAATQTLANVAKSAAMVRLKQELMSGTETERGKQGKTTRRYAKSGFIENIYIEQCTFCRNIAPETIEHMLLECSQWQALKPTY